MCIWFMHRLRVSEPPPDMVLSTIDLYFAFNQNGYFTISDNIIAIYDMASLERISHFTYY